MATKPPQKPVGALSSSRGAGAATKELAVPSQASHKDSFAAGIFYLAQIALMTVVEGTLVQMLLSKAVNYPYPLVITFWGRFSGFFLVASHFLFSGGSWRRCCRETKRVIVPAARLAILFVGAACTFNYGLQFSTVANAMILSTGCPVYTMLMSKIFLPNEDAMWVHILSGWAFCTAGVCIVTLLGKEKVQDGKSISKHVFGDLLFVSSSVLWAFSTVLVKVELTQDELKHTAFEMVARSSALLHLDFFKGAAKNGIHLPDGWFNALEHAEPDVDQVENQSLLAGNGSGSSAADTNGVRSSGGIATAQSNEVVNRNNTSYGGVEGTPAAPRREEEEERFTAANYPHSLLWGYIAFVGSLCMLPLLYLDRNSDGTRGIVIPVTGLQMALLGWNCVFGVLWHSVLYGKAVETLPSATVVLGLCLTTPLGLVSDVLFHGKAPTVAQILGAALVIVGVTIAILEPGKEALRGDEGDDGAAEAKKPLAIQSGRSSRDLQDGVQSTSDADSHPTVISDPLEDGDLALLGIDQARDQTEFSSSRNSSGTDGRGGEEASVPSSASTSATDADVRDEQQVRAGQWMREDLGLRSASEDDRGDEQEREQHSRAPAFAGVVDGATRDEVGGEEQRSRRGAGSSSKTSRIPFLYIAVGLMVVHLGIFAGLYMGRKSVSLNSRLIG